MSESKATYTVEEAAVVLGIGRSSAYNGVASGEIPSVRVGRRRLIPKQALERWLAGESSPAPPTGLREVS